jgi:cytosine/adenosine deaminase-related metal-dependent hydrolase
MNRHIQLAWVGSSSRTAAQQRRAVGRRRALFHFSLYCLAPTFFGPEHSAALFNAADAWPVGRRESSAGEGVNKRTLIQGGRVLTLDPQIGDFEVADVLLDGEHIAEVGPSLRADDCEVIDAAGMIVSPGFVDTHRHVWQTQLRGVAADWSLFDYVSQMRSIYSAFYEPEDAYLGNHIGALEALDAGVTTLVDHCHIINSPEHADEAIRGLMESGIRGIFCYGLFSNPLPSPLRHEPDSSWRPDDARRVRARHFASDDGRLTMGFAPGEVEAMPFDAICAEISLGRELGAKRISCHVAMGAYDNGRRIVAELNKLNLLSDDLLFVHGSSLTDEELGYIADHGAAISTTPETELQMAMGHPVVSRAQEHGAIASLGVDIVSNFAGDLFTQMRLQLQVERGRRNGRLGAPPRAISPRAREVLELATREGARAAGLDSQIGSLSPGKQADVILTRTDALHTAGIADPVAALVLYARPTDVDTVFVAGQLVKRSGKLIGVNWPALRDRLVQSSERIREGFESVDAGPVVELAAHLMLPAR